MGLFSRNKKFSHMLTPEEQYRASAAHTEEQYRREAQAQAFRTEYDERREARRAATEARRGQVVRAGTLRRRGNSVILEGDWQLATDKLPVGDLSGTVYRGRLGDLTVKDLHALASNHGPKCRCGI
ncbi:MULTISPECIES: hypothetical protein [unclassified Streptomyces]|uniref:hypothetical protein n=1 Tax=unclassified Streptomyces TaxID=2593676 RepID=UPI00344D2855